ncbi:MAG: ATP-binding protein [Candidatus Margulisiibacteriota bacterium]
MANQQKMGSRRSLLLWLTIISVVIFAALAVNRVTLLQEMLMKRILYRMETVGNILSAEIIEDLLANNPDGARNSVDTAADQPLVKFVSIIGPKGAIVVSSRRQLENRANTYQDTADIHQARNDLFIKSFPLKKGDIDHGQVQVAFSLRQLRQDINSIMLWSAFLSSLGLALILTTAVLLTTMQKKQLEDVNRKLLELDKMKSEFVSVASHELRTPLTSIVGFARTMIDIPLPEEKKEQYLKVIETEGLRLARIVEVFLSISRIEAGNIKLEIKKIELSELAAKIIAATEVKNNIKIISDLPEPIFLEADPDRIEQVIVNLLGNALRYTKPGGKVTISARESGANVEVSVEDEGPGIAAECLPRLFEKFYRCGDEITQKHRGTGLGLSICKGLVELHNGWIRAESKVNQGSKFTFALPIKQGG